MGRIIISMPDDLELKFREKAMKRFGVKLCYLKKALLEAVDFWIKGELPPIKEEDDDGSN